jgi:hypothetical protein
MITTKFLEAFGSYGTADSVVWAWIGKLATDHWVKTQGGAQQDYKLTAQQGPARV